MRLVATILHLNRCKYSIKQDTTLPHLIVSEAIHYAQLNPDVLMYNIHTCFCICNSKVFMVNIIRRYILSIQSAMKLCFLIMQHLHSAKHRSIMLKYTFTHMLLFLAKAFIFPIITTGIINFNFLIFNN